jgi:GT2 family glycosyltransferase
VKVIAVVPTFNRGAELSACLSGLASQTRPIAAAIVVDNASTEPIRSVLERKRYPFPVGYIRLSTNAGSAGGFAAAVKAALESGADWVWLQDSDGVADPACLDVLTGAAARAPDAAVLAPQVYDEAGGVQGQHRGRYIRGHTLPVRQSTYERDLVPIDYASNIGILVSADKVADAGGPDPRLYIWIDDLEWCLRLREHGPLYLVPSAVINHNDGITGRSAGSWATLRTHLLPGPNSVLWRYLYAFRNSSWLRKNRHDQGPLGWFANYLVQSARVLLVGPHRTRAPRLFWWYGMAGRHGVWGQIPDARWKECLQPGGDLRLVHPRNSPFIEFGASEQPPVDWL